jgi:hypothetical protein
MTTDTRRPKVPSRGKLRVEIRSPSVLLTTLLPVEVRDAEQKLVDTLRGGSHGIDLPVGLYSVTALLGNGRREPRLVQIEGGRTTTVLFDPPPMGAARSYDAMEAMLAGRAFLRVSAEVAITLASPGVAVVHVGRGRWLVTPERLDWEGVPWLALAGGGEVVRVALPINPAGTTADERSCIVEASWSSVERIRAGRLRVRVAPAPERRVTAAIQGLAESGNLVHGAEFASMATELLQDKYSDPVGAALGGLLLHRIGRLADRTEWVENLARDFPWLPDGRILLSALLADSGKATQRRRGLALLLAATSRMPTMFSDSYSLAISLLRRRSVPERLGSDDQDRPEREVRLSTLVEQARQVDYSSVCFVSRGWAEPAVADMGALAPWFGQVAGE